MEQYPIPIATVPEEFPSSLSLVAKAPFVNLLPLDS